MERWNWDDVAAQEIADRFRGWTSCTPRGAMDELATYLHPDFVYVSVFGKRYTKESYLELAGSVTSDAYYVVHDARARVRGDVAEIDGEYFVSAVTDGGDDLTAHTRFTGTWVRDSGTWVALTHHGTHYDPAGSGSGSAQPGSALAS
jgi:hypothetical protein